MYGLADYPVLDGQVFFLILCRVYHPPWYILRVCTNTWLANFHHSQIC